MWFRVFGTNDVQPDPAVLLVYLHELDPEFTVRFSTDEQGWFRLELRVADDAAPLVLERYLSTEEGIRAELNTWAAWLETADRTDLMQQMISTRQVFTLQRPEDDEDEPGIEPLCVGLCRFLARMTAGVYQVDQQGFFAADGTLLVRE